MKWARIRFGRCFPTTVVARRYVRYLAREHALGHCRWVHVFYFGRFYMAIGGRISRRHDEYGVER